MFGILAKMRPPKRENISTAVVEETVDVEAYRMLAHDVGFPCEDVIVRHERHLRVQELRLFLANSGITVFPEHSVERYMNSITPRGYRWKWVALDSYTRAIPAPVLLTIKSIKDAFRDARFCITDIEAIPDPDPFLQVHIRHSAQMFIIERWDEPGFRM